MYLLYCSNSSCISSLKPSTASLRRLFFFSSVSLSFSGGFFILSSVSWILLRVLPILSSCFLVFSVCLSGFCFFVFFFILSVFSFSLFLCRLLVPFPFFILSRPFVLFYRRSVLLVFRHYHCDHLF